MVDLQKVQAQAPALDIEQLRNHGLVIVYDDTGGRVGAAEVRQIINVLLAVHPRGSELFQPDSIEDEIAAATADGRHGMTFMVDIPSVRLIPQSSSELHEAIAGEAGAILDLRRS